MKKTPQNVFVRTLSLALVMALLFTSVISSLAFTASADAAETGTYYKKVIDFEGENPHDGASTTDSRFSFGAGPAGGTGKSLHRSYSDSNTKNASVKFTGLQLSAGTTYLIKYDYYITSPDGVTYSNRWHALLANSAQIVSKNPSSDFDGKWQTVSYMYTPTQDITTIELKVANFDVYFDNFTVMDYKGYLGTVSDSVYEVDFSEYTNGADVPLYAMSDGLSVVKDENGSNVVAANLTQNSPAGGAFIPMHFKANTKYTVTITYKTTGWCCSSTGKALDGSGSKDLNSSGYRTKTYTVTNETDTFESNAINQGGFLGFGTTFDNAFIYISYIKVVEVFDTAVATAENGSATVSAAEAGYGSTVTFTATPANGYYLDYWKNEKGERVSETAVYEHTVTGDVTLTPVFAKDTNSAARQAYDFDKLVPTISGASALETVMDRNGATTSALKVYNDPNNNRDHYVNLAYPLIDGKQYKLSYDYKGTARAGSRICVTGYRDAQNTEIGGTLDHYNRFASDIWQHHETVFTASDALAKLYFFTPSWLLNDSTNGDTVYFDNIVIEEYTPGSDNFFKSYEEDFENGEKLAGASLLNLPVATVKDDPTRVNGKSLALSNSGYTNYDLAAYRFQAGHTYIMAMDVYTPGEEAHSFRMDIKNGDNAYAKEGYSWITGPAGSWQSEYRTYTATADNQFISLFVNQEVYIDNFKLIDITNDKGYHEDFANPDSVTLLDNVSANVTYENDANLGKTVAVIAYPAAASIDANKILIPYRLQNGVQYRVRVTYTATAWCCPSFNGEVHGRKGITGDYSTSWVTQDWYVTGSGDNDFFGFTSNQSSAVLKISDIRIEKMSGRAGDLDNDGVLSAIDLTLLRKHLLGIASEEAFVNAGEIITDGKIDIRDFVRLKKLLSVN